MTVLLFATYREITKCKQVDLPAPKNVWALLEDISNRFGARMREELFSPDGAQISDTAIVMVNGRHIEHLSGGDTPLADRDQVALFPLVAGG